jgi:AcrR family transcriptional regulator
MATKEKIIDAALQVLLDGGFSALTQTRVAEVAGLGQGNLTYHFPKRSDLLRAVIDVSKTKLRLQLSSQTKGSLTLKKLQTLVTHHALSENFPRLMLALTLASADDPTLCTWFEQNDRESRMQFREALQTLGMKVNDSDLHLLRATVIGASLIYLQQQTDAAKKTAQAMIAAAFKQLMTNARAL